MIKDTDYKTLYDVTKNTTTIIILYNGCRVLSLEYYGQIKPCAVREYAAEAIQLLIDKGVIKNGIDGFKRRRNPYTRL